MYADKDYIVKIRRELHKVPELTFELPKTLAIVRQNIVFSLVVKLGCLLLTAVGLTNMWWAIFADVGVMVLAVLNATRALKAPRV